MAHMFNIRVVFPAIIDIGKQARSHKIPDISRDDAVDVICLFNEMSEDKTEGNAEFT